MTVSRNLILIAIVIFAVLGFGWLGAGTVEPVKLISVVALGLAFHAAAHI